MLNLSYQQEEKKDPSFKKCVDPKDTGLEKFNNFTDYS